MVILGIEGDERTAGFAAAVARAGGKSVLAPVLAPVRVLDYRAFIENPERLPDMFGAEGGRLRFDSPGGDCQVWRAIASFGAPAMREKGLTPLDDDALDAFAADPGVLTATHQHHLGFVRVLRLARSLTPPGVRLLNDVDAIELFYDKSACHAFMERNGFPVPRGLGPVWSFGELLDAMRGARVGRAFVKERHGSGAAGLAAVAVSPHGVKAWSSAELVRDGRGERLYNTKRVREYNGAEAAELIDALCLLDGSPGAHAEQWIPKAAVDGHVCDLRVLVIAGEPAHTVLRMSRGPITNLDLRNRRENADLLREKLAPGVWEALMDDCRRFAALFPQALQVSLDAAIAINLRRHVFFEANAFGDLLRRVSWNGLDPYGAQVAALERQGAAA